MAPNKIPNLNHNLLKGVSILEFKIPKIKKMIDITIDQILTSFPFKTGHKPMIKNKIENTTPKFLFELIFMSLVFKLS